MLPRFCDRLAVYSSSVEVDNIIESEKELWTGTRPWGLRPRRAGSRLFWTAQKI
jgi:hypothetical protein